MCNLYSMTRNREAILRLFRVSHNRAAATSRAMRSSPAIRLPSCAAHPMASASLWC